MIRTNIAAGSTLTLCVRIERVTSFWRYNRYTHHQELKYTISMSEVGAPLDDPWYVTFTSGKFADEVKEGEELAITGKFKKMQEYNNMVQYVLTHCKVK